MKKNSKNRNITEIYKEFFKCSPLQAQAVPGTGIEEGDLSDHAYSVGCIIKDNANLKNN